MTAIPVMPLAPAICASNSPGEPRLEALREQIRSIEQRPALLSRVTGPLPRLGAVSALGPAGDPPAAATRTVAWTLGDAISGGPRLGGIDRAIGTGGLEIGAVHEIKPAIGTGWAAANASACHFALALAARRLIAAPPAERSRPVLLCFSTSSCGEMGFPYAPGLAGLGLDPERVIVVEAARQSDVLWAIEEGLKSEGLALVLGQTDALCLTPARRLALAAAATSTPCLLLTHPRSAAAAATATRWRIAPAPSAPHPLDPEAPGETRFLAGLERCRGSPAAVQPVSYLLEWCHAAYRFRVAAGVVDGASRPRAPEDRPARAVGGGERP